MEGGGREGYSRERERERDEWAILNTVSNEYRSRFNIVDPDDCITLGLY